MDCHPEIAILKMAVDCLVSNTLYIGISKRPCYCCALLFKAIAETKSVDFEISTVTTNGKLYGNWRKIDGYFVKEFTQVWGKIIQLKGAFGGFGTGI